MGSLLDAVNVSTSQCEFIIGELSKKSGEVSLMTIKQVFEALTISPLKDELKFDPTRGYDSSTYFIYAINDAEGENDSVSNSTKDNLEAIGADWYKQLNKPVIVNERWLYAGAKVHHVFGGPLNYVNYNSSDGYTFHWYYSESSCDHSSGNCYWNHNVPDYTYVAIVHS